MAANLQRDMYTELKADSRQIRLLQVGGGKFEDDIICSLKVTSLDDEAAYEALSYVWGDPGTQKQITLDGKTFSVTENLADALCHLRHANKERILWVDALCIDQENVQERNHQVRFMRDIYQNATCVIAWLGIGKDQDARAFEAARQVAADDSLHWAAVPSTIDGEKKFIVNIWEIFSLVLIPWWDRMWIVQEYVLAREVIFTCGKQAIPSSNLIALAKTFFQHRATCCRDMDNDPHVLISPTLQSHLHAMLELEKLRESKSRVKFPELIGLYRARKTTDPRDKVYGLLGLSEPLDDLKIRYDLPLREAYEDACVGIIRSTGSLDIFSHVLQAQPRRRNQETGPEIELPSWVPNWTADIHSTIRQGQSERAKAYQYFNASVGHPLELLQHVPGNLTLRGIVVDVIDSVGENHERPILARVNHIHQWRSMAGIDSNPDKPYVDGKSTWFDAFWRTICLNYDYLQEKSADEDVRLLHEAWWWGQLIEKYTSAKQYDDNFEPVDNPYKNMVDCLTFNGYLLIITGQRRFFISKTGYMGICPSRTQPGDKICVLFGGRTPFVLRKSESEETNTFELLGDSYVHGLMEGQALDLVKEGDLQLSDIILT